MTVAGIASSLFFVAPYTSYSTESQHYNAKKPRIAPIFTKPGGQTYGRWAAGWWQYALGVPADTNPVLDETGENCDVRQVDDVWFLVGSFGSDPIVRNCTVPKDKSLFFPLVNSLSGAFLSDPPEERTEEFLRERAKCEFPVSLFAEIDGFRIRRLERFFTGKTGRQSPLFNIQLPPGNIFGATEDAIPELVLSPSAEQGFYLFVYPLSPGEHTIHWRTTGCGSPQDITYNLTVLDDGDDDEDKDRDED